jgi:hypothetical protein
MHNHFPGMPFRYRLHPPQRDSSPTCLQAQTVSGQVSLGLRPRCAPIPFLFMQPTVINLHGSRHSCNFGPHVVQDMREELLQQKVLGYPHFVQKAATLS